MEKTEFDVAMRSLGLTKRIGTYDYNGELCDLFCWQDYCFYFTREKRVYISGKFPLPLVYQIYRSLNGNEGFTSESGKREWKVDHLTVDDGINFSKAKYYENHITGFNRTFSLTSLEDMFEIVLKIENFRRKNAGLELISEEKIFEYSEQVKLETATIFINRRKITPQIEKNLLKKTRNPKNWLLKITLTYLDSVINPLQGGRFVLDDYANYSKRMTISAETTSPEEMRIVYTPSEKDGLTSYEITDNHVIYDATKLTDDTQYKRVRHMFTEYSQNDHMTGEIVEIISGIISSNDDELVKRQAKDFIYNVTENAICENGVWKEATAKDLVRIQSEILEAIDMSRTITLDNMLRPDHKLNFKPIAN